MPLIMRRCFTHEVAEHHGHFLAEGNSPGLSVGMNKGWWHYLLNWGLEHSPKLTRDGMATATIGHASACLHRCHLINIGIVLVGSMSLNPWLIGTIVLIRGKRVTTQLDTVSNYRTIWGRDVLVEFMIWYIISSRCGQILSRSVKLWYLTGMNTITFGFRYLVYNVHSYRT
jgi:hypothetical protein